jgi:uncharacterized protein
MMSMKQVHLRLYEELNDYLPEGRRKQCFEIRFEGAMSAAELLRAVGVPISEVDLILCHDTSVGIMHRLCDGDRLGVFPVFEALDLRDLSKVRTEPLRRPAFVAGPGLKRLATYMRMLGFDTRFEEGSSLSEAASMAEAEQRILITRAPLPQNTSRAILVHDRKPRLQVKRVIARLDLQRRITPLGRCPHCNSRLPRPGIPFHCESCDLNCKEGARSRRIQRIIRHISSF